MTERRLNATAASLLGFLHERPMSGYELAATAAHVIGDFWTLTQSQVYRELAWMADGGLVTAGERGARERRPFAITDAGREAFAGWVVLPPGARDDPPPAAAHAELRTPRAARPPRRASSGVIATRTSSGCGPTSARSARLRASDAEPIRFTAATLAFGIAYERATLAWFDALPDSLSDAGDDRSPDA